MRNKLLSLTVGLIALYALLVAPTATAAESVAVTVDVRDGIAWVEADVAGPLDGLVIKIMAPRSASSRTLWQTCRFRPTHAGTYRCGIDVAEGSLAKDRNGTWVANVFYGGVRLARTTFTF